MTLDAKIKKDCFGYYVVLYRIIDGIETEYVTNKAISNILNFLEKDYKDWLICEFESDEKSKNNIMHFQTYEKANKLVDELRNIIPRGLKENKLFLARWYDWITKI